MKIRNPSNHLIFKYKKKQNKEPEPEPEPVFEAPVQEPEYDDINLSAIKNKKKKDKKMLVDDQEAERLAREQERKKAKKMEIRRLKELDEDVGEYWRRSDALKREYTEELEKLKRLPQTKVNKENYQQRIQKNVQDKKDLKVRFGNLLDYMKKNKLNPDDLNAVHRFH